MGLRSRPEREVLEGVFRHHGDWVGRRRRPEPVHRPGEHRSGADHCLQYKLQRHPINDSNAPNRRAPALDASNARALNRAALRAGRRIPPHTGPFRESILRRAATLREPNRVPPNHRAPALDASNPRAPNPPGPVLLLDRHGAFANLFFDPRFGRPNVMELFRVRHAVLPSQIRLRPQQEVPDILPVGRAIVVAQ